MVVALGMGYLEHGIGGFLGSALLVALIILGLAWILVPIWVWSIRDNMKKHIAQQEEILTVLYRQEQALRDHRKT
ncbi:hypothetical protein [Aquibaculum arenosum]|uniref:Uncharacterized protein n=1 Tax=Aquibaculum arenosum TaxID=3032591 RepID=A0ABT5YHU0_9PROT|nr:hypothetical protein [Fodinicurvata sp. CAU 1616]MDF2094383.1 hypothetical protein [Fodinicurvata sp. CAU 1616]